MERVVKGKQGQIYGTEGNLTLGGKRRMQHTDDVAQNYTLENYIILLMNVNPINLIFF